MRAAFVEKLDQMRSIILTRRAEGGGPPASENRLFVVDIVKCSECYILQLLLRARHVLGRTSAAVTNGIVTWREIAIVGVDQFPPSLHDRSVLARLCRHDPFSIGFGLNLITYIL